MKQVIEIIERCAEGTCVSRPFLVRADDDHLYWIKGCGTGWSRNELCYELLAARLATALNLPVADYEILDVQQSLLEFSAVPEIGALAAGPAFGSLHVDDAVSLPPVQITAIPEDLRQRILLFDWWIRNEDRILGENGGNVNLLWTPSHKRLTIIDHNNAFDNTFDESKFFENHVFRDERGRMKAFFLLEQEQAFVEIAARLQVLLSDFPAEWDEDHGQPGTFDHDYVNDILSRSGKIGVLFGGHAE